MRLDIYREKCYLSMEDDLMRLLSNVGHLCN